MSPARDPDPARTAARRAIARRLHPDLHPDLGGDPTAYLAALASLEAAPTDRLARGFPVEIRRTHWSRARSGLRRHRRRWVARRRASRYTEL